MNTKLIVTIAAAAAAASLSGQTLIPAGQMSVTGAPTTWTTANDPYILQGAVFCDVDLIIQAGVVVRGQPRTADKSLTPTGDPGSLIVTTQGTINASGSPSLPIIFTTAAVDNNGDGIADDADSNGFKDAWVAGDAFLDANPKTSVLPQVASGPHPGATGVDPAGNVEHWGGLVLLGRAPVNLGKTDNPAAGVGNIEGLPASIDSEYGGTDPNDSSGILEYVSIRYGGDVIGSANEINGLTLGGVGRGTVINHVEVYQTWDDGFEWFGGTVDCDHLLSIFIGDDSFDGDQGYTGIVQFAVAVQPTEDLGSKGGDKGFEFDGEDGDLNTDLDGNPAPYQAYQFANFSILGNGSAGAMDLKADYSGIISNGMMANIGGGVGIYNDQSSLDIVIQAVSYDKDSSAGTITDATGTTTTTGIVAATTDIFVGEDQATAAGLDLRPSTPAGFGFPVALPAGAFVPASYRGAIAPGTGPGLTWPAVWSALDLNPVFVP